MKRQKNPYKSGFGQFPYSDSPTSKRQNSLKQSQNRANMAAFERSFQKISNISGIYPIDPELGVMTI